jgi:hypothetical protein
VTSKTFRESKAILSGLSYLVYRNADALQFKSSYASYIAPQRGQELQALATDTESIKVAHDAVQAELQHTKATLEETLVALAGAQAAHDATQTTLSDTLRQVEGLKQDILAREEEVQFKCLRDAIDSSFSC